MASARSSGRDVHIYDAKDRSRLLGGLILNNGVTKLNFYSMVEVWIFFESSFVIENEAGMALEKTEEPLIRGNYYIVGRLRALPLQWTNG